MTFQCSLMCTKATRKSIMYDLWSFLLLNTLKALRWIDFHLSCVQNESMYDQKPEEPKPALPSLIASAAKSGPSLHSRFEYVENEPSAVSRTRGAQVTGHIAPPKLSNFFQVSRVWNG